MLHSGRFSGVGLVAFLLAASLFPAEASTPCLPSGAGMEVQGACSSSDIMAAAWGSCEGGGNCCFGMEESPCSSWRVY